MKICKGMEKFTLDCKFCLSNLVIFFIFFDKLSVLSFQLFRASTHRDTKERMNLKRSEQDISFVAFNQEVWNWKVFRWVCVHSTNIHTEFLLKSSNTAAFGTNDYGTVLANEWNCEGKWWSRRIWWGRHNVVIGCYLYLYYRCTMQNQFCCIDNKCYTQLNKMLY